MDFLTSIGLKLMAKLPGCLQMWYWSASRLADNLDLEPRGRGDPITVQKGDEPQIEIWLRATNLSPLHLYLDRVKVELWSNGRVGEYWWFDSRELAPQERTEILLRGFMRRRELENIRQESGSSYVECHITAHGYSKVRRFRKDDRNMGRVAVKVQN